MVFLITTLILVVTILANIALAGLILRSGVKKRIHQILAIHITGIIGWAFFILLIIWLPNFIGIWEYGAGEFGYLLEKLIFISSVIWLSANYWFVQYFTKNKFPRSLFNYTILAFQVLILVLSSIDNVLYTKVVIQPQGYAFLEIQPLSLLFTIFVFSHLLLPLFFLFRAKSKEIDRIKRAQLRILFAIYLLFFIFSAAFNWVLPVYFQIFTFNAFGPTISLILVGGITYAITRHQFLDIRIVIQRGIIYTSLFAIVVGFYLTTIFILGLIFQQTTNITILVSAGLTTILGIFGVPPIGRYFRRVTDRIFFKDKYDYSEAMHELSEILNKTLDLQEILTKSSEKLQEICKAEKVVITCFIKGKTSKGKFRDQDHKKSIVIPIVLEDRDIGEIQIAEKLSGDSYMKEDFALLRTFSYQIGVALDKAHVYEQLKEYTLGLEKKVHQRTAQIQSLQEEQAQMMIDISHGLQTPLTIMKGELGSLQKQIPEHTTMSALEKSIDEISKFIYDLLSLAQLESKREDFKGEFINFSELLNGLVEYLNVLVREKDITLISSIERDIITVGKKEKIEELVVALVSNAIKYISNERKIWITLRRSDSVVELIVEDTGIGIHEDDLPYIFDRFYRMKDRNHTDIQGVGLGLAICKKIVEKHNGTIDVASESGKGTTFNIKFWNREEPATR